jgi:phosphoenolpyruvate synthase/pyruvate phosphate dikinase
MGATRDPEEEFSMSETTYVVRPDEQAGFVMTAAAYREFARSARLRPLIATQLRRLHGGTDVVAVGAYIRTAFFDAEVPAGLVAAIEEACARFGGPETEFVVGGVIAGDQLDEFLTGPHEVFVGVHGKRALLAAVKRCWGSLFSDRAIIYREVRDIDHLSVDLAVRIEPMDTLSVDRSADAELQGVSAG